MLWNVYKRGTSRGYFTKPKKIWTGEADTFQHAMIRGCAVEERRSAWGLNYALYTASRAI